jgi:CheY-like chemotaxis protein
MVGQQNDRVLLVEDDPVVRRVISRQLVASGYVVRGAVDGLDALGKLRTGLPDLIISDLNMPRMSGLELLEIVRKRFPQIPVIVISTIATDEMPEGVAADAYCQKTGFGFEPLLQTVSNLTTKPPLRTAPLYVHDDPVQAICDKDGDYIISCKDCLRTFSVPSARTMRRDEKWTICVHCGKVVQFVVAEADPQGPALP